MLIFAIGGSLWWLRIDITSLALMMPSGPPTPSCPRRPAASLLGLFTPIPPPRLASFSSRGRSPLNGAASAWASMPSRRDYQNRRVGGARNTAMNCLGANIGDCIPLANRCADRQVDGAGRCCSLRCVRPIFEPRQISNRPLMFCAHASRQRMACDC